MRWEDIIDAVVFFMITLLLTFVIVSIGKIVINDHPQIMQFFTGK